MTTLTLNEELLNVLCLIKDKQKLAIAESVLGLTDDWLQDVKAYIFSLPVALMSGLELKRNEQLVKQIVNFSIPAEWLSSQSDELALFTFSY